MKKTAHIVCPYPEEEVVIASLSVVSKILKLETSGDIETKLNFHLLRTIMGDFAFEDKKIAAYLCISSELLLANPNYEQFKIEYLKGKVKTWTSVLQNHLGFTPQESWALLYVERKNFEGLIDFGGEYEV